VVGGVLRSSLLIGEPGFQWRLLPAHLLVFSRWALLTPAFALEIKVMVDRIWIHVTLGLAVLGGSAGCGRTNLVKVKGLVTLDGKPLSSATITFVRIGGEGRPASGLSDADGNFQLTTLRTNDGAAPGEYKVTVTKEQAAEPVKINPSEGPKGLAAMFAKKAPEARKKEAQARLKAPVLLPRIYSDSTRTPLKEVVPPEGPIRLELNSKQ
jgi:hypothetical protein